MSCHQSRTNNGDRGGLVKPVSRTCCVSQSGIASPWASRRASPCAPRGILVGPRPPRQGVRRRVREFQGPRRRAGDSAKPLRASAGSEGARSPRRGAGYSVLRVGDRGRDRWIEPTGVLGLLAGDRVIVRDQAGTSGTPRACRWRRSDSRAIGDRQLRAALPEPADLCPDTHELVENCCDLVDADGDDEARSVEPYSVDHVALAKEVPELLRGFQAANDTSRASCCAGRSANAPTTSTTRWSPSSCGSSSCSTRRSATCSDSGDASRGTTRWPVSRSGLREDAASCPNTRQQRYGALAQRLVLFRIFHDGAEADELRLPPRHGELFGPASFPFLGGRSAGGVRQIPRGDRAAAGARRHGLRRARQAAGARRRAHRPAPSSSRPNRARSGGRPIADTIIGTSPEILQTPARIG